MSNNLENNIDNLNDNEISIGSFISNNIINHEYFNSQNLEGMIFSNLYKNNEINDSNFVGEINEINHKKFNTTQNNMLNDEFIQDDNIYVNEGKNSSESGNNKFESDEISEEQNNLHNKNNYSINDCLEHSNNDNQILENSGSNSNYIMNNIFIKKYYLYKWRTILQEEKITQQKTKYLLYIINIIDIKKRVYLLKKYFNKWHSLFNFNNTKQLNIAIKNNMKELVKRLRDIDDKTKRDKIIKIYEYLGNNYVKIFEDLNDIYKKKEKNYIELNSNQNNRETKFIQNINKMYNKGKKFKFFFNNINK